MAWSKIRCLALGVVLACAGAVPETLPAAPNQAAALGNDAAHRRQNAGDVSAYYHSCWATADNTSTMRECDLGENNRLDWLVATTYRKRLAALSGDRAAALRRDQRQWLKRRRDYCLNLPGTGGTIDLIDLDECFIYTSIERVRVLERSR